MCFIRSRPARRKFVQLIFNWLYVNWCEMEIPSVTFLLLSLLLNEYFSSVLFLLLEIKLKWEKNLFLSHGKRISLIFFQFSFFWTELMKIPTRTKKFSILWRRKIFSHCKKKFLRELYPLLSFYWHHQHSNKNLNHMAKTCVVL